MRNDKIAVNERLSLGMCADAGILNELNAQAIFDDLKATIKQPALGYFYSDDVNNYISKKIESLLN